MSNFNDRLADPSDIGYKPEDGNQAPFQVREAYNTQQGYFNLPLLKEMLKTLIEATEENIRLSEGYLEAYALKVDDDTRLQHAQSQEWPESLGSPKDSVTYKQYKAMRKLNTRSSDYIVKLYEKYARGPSGNHNIDLVLANEVINAEAKNIEGFLETSLGDVTHTSEYRTIEIFQDWAQDALTFTGQLGSLTKKGAKGEHTETIPQAELDKISKPDAVQFQSLFKTKVNAFNEQIAQLTETLYKDATQHAKAYYSRFLGPTLRFDINLSSRLQRNASDSFLGRHAQAGQSSFAWQMEEMLTDGLKRNETFRANMQGLIFVIDKRDDYNGFIRQLEAKGAQIKQLFVEDSLSSEEEAEFHGIVRQITEEAPPIDEEFVSDHNALDNLDDPDAHPQYLLKEGDTITGDIDVADGVKIDGVDLDLHEHDGIDTPKIKGENIEGGTLGTDVIDRSERPSPPMNLKIKRINQDVVPPGLSVFDITLAWDGELNYNYEVQAVPYEF